MAVARVIAPKSGIAQAISLTNSAGEHKIFVRIYKSDVGRLSAEQEAQLAVEYVGHLIQTGWSPDQYRGQPGELVVPKGFGSSQNAVKRSWLQRLFGRGD